jgi:uncharacterized damage-inducible protein DinB
MRLTEILLPEFDREMATTRRLLARARDEDFAWKPHEKSMTLHQLVAHLAQLPWWGEVVLTIESLDLGGDAGDRTIPANRAEVVATFDRHVAATRSRLNGKTDAELVVPWTLKRGDDEIFTMPRMLVFRTMVLSPHDPSPGTVERVPATA